MMSIQVETALTTLELKECKKLMKECQLYDNTHRQPYLSNGLNFDATMPAFFLDYQEEKLVGLLAVYADNPDEGAELTVLVHPDYRLQGIARRLYQAALEALAPYHLKSPSFVTEQVFLETASDLPAKWGLKRSKETETLLSRGRDRFDLRKKEKISVHVASSHHIEAVARFQASAFELPLEVSLQYAREAVSDTNSLLYILEQDGVVLASCTVDVSSPFNYLYGLAVADSHRGQGFGSYLVQSLIHDLLSRNEKSFQIAVEDDNSGARRLYEKLGFSYQTQVVYLDSLSS